MKRTVPLKRGGRLARRTPMRKIRPQRASEMAIYYRRRKEYLRRHPICELWLIENSHQAFNGRILNETDVDDFLFLGAPRSILVHHRNKRRGARLLDETEWMALSQIAHDRIEGNKAWARENGYLRNF